LTNVYIHNIITSSKAKLAKVSDAKLKGLRFVMAASCRYQLDDGFFYAKTV